MRYISAMPDSRVAEGSAKHSPRVLAEGPLSQGQLPRQVPEIPEASGDCHRFDAVLVGASRVRITP